LNYNKTTKISNLYSLLKYLILSTFLNQTLKKKIVLSILNIIKFLKKQLVEICIKILNFLSLIIKNNFKHNLTIKIRSSLN